jgi:hypothetical protein
MPTRNQDKIAPTAMLKTHQTSSRISFTDRTFDDAGGRETSPNASLTARAPWKRAGGGSIYSGLARPYPKDYYRGRERSSGLLGDGIMETE